MENWVYWSKDMKSFVINLLIMKRGAIKIEKAKYGG